MARTIFARCIIPMVLFYRLDDGWPIFDAHDSATFALVLGHKPSNGINDHLYYRFAARGDIVQGIGAVLFEECIYSEDANVLNVWLSCPYARRDA